MDVANAVFVAASCVVESFDTTHRRGELRVAPQTCRRTNKIVLFVEGIGWCRVRVGRQRRVHALVGVEGAFSPFIACEGGTV